MPLRRTLIGLGSVIVLALVPLAACTQQESGTAVPSSHDGESTGPSVSTESTSPDDSGSTDLGPTDLGPTDLGPTDLGPTDLGPTDLTDLDPTDGTDLSPTEETESAPTEVTEPTTPDDTGEVPTPDTATAQAPGSGTATATQSTSAWAVGPNKTGGTPVPVFPDSLPGWRLNNSWDATTRATVADWSPAKGPDSGDFPTTVNGCDVQRFLVRWRANDDQARIEARWINAAGIPGQSVSGHAGWFDLDGCTTPQFRFITSDGVTTRSSVNVSVQQYFPEQ